MPRRSQLQSTTTAIAAPAVTRLRSRSAGQHRHFVNEGSIADLLDEKIRRSAREMNPDRQSRASKEAVRDPVVKTVGRTIVQSRWLWRMIHVVVSVDPPKEQPQCGIVEPSMASAVAGS
jgi:hypothetical protein